MNSHLSSEEMCQWLSGEPMNEAEEHVRECPACRQELQQLRTALDGLRSSLEQAVVPPVRYSNERAVLPRWILATAVLSTLIAAPVYWNVRQQRAAEQAKADELLLERVNAGLSRSVPASMEPLMQLISREDK